MTTEAMRAEFEAWAKREGLRISRGDTAYFEWETHIAWLAFQFAWQASAEEERGRVKVLQDALTEIASFTDKLANAHLESVGSYSAFDEPGSVQIARAALNRTAAQQET